MDLPKPVQLDLTTVDGNAFAIMGAWSRQAKREGWTQEQRDHVLNDAKSSDYQHLLYTIQEQCDADA